MEAKTTPKPEVDEGLWPAFDTFTRRFFTWIEWALMTAALGAIYTTLKADQAHHQAAFTVVGIVYVAAQGVLTLWTTFRVNELFYHLFMKRIGGGCFAQLPLVLLVGAVTTYALWMTTKALEVLLDAIARGGH